MKKFDRNKMFHIPRSENKIKLGLFQNKKKTSYVNMQDHKNSYIQ